MEIPVVAKVTVISPYTIEVVFTDGHQREINLENELWGEVFEPLRDPDEFAKAFVDQEAGTVCWPNGADLAPQWLYEPDPEKWQKLVEESRALEANQRSKSTRKKQDARI